MRSTMRLATAIGLAAALLLTAAAEPDDQRRRQEARVAPIADGRPGTAMPSWRPFITDIDVRWLIFRLKQGDPNALR